jgi:hypothetical protein
VTDPAATVFAPAAPVVRLVRDHVLDAELAALLSLTVEGGIPLVVAGGAAEDRCALRDVLVALVPGGVPVVRLAGDGEDFGWMPEARELGWRPTGPSRSRTPGAVMVADLEDGKPGATWGEAAHLAIRALTVGYSLLATSAGATLPDVLARLAAPPVAAIDDELTRLGVVLVLADGPRVESAHYLRPVARDPGGHVQRLSPAVLATWNGNAGHYDHFAWGVVPELAGRTGRRPIEFEREQAQRAQRLAAECTKA